MNMEPLNIYRAKGKEIGLVFLFKYDLNGNLKLFEISEGELNEEQITWLFSHFPARESIMQTIWNKVEKILKIFTIEKSPADLSFEAAWEIYYYKVSKLDAEKAFKKMNEADKIQFFLSLPKYERYLKTSKIAKAHLSTYINKRYFENEYPEEIKTKNFNPMLQDLANKKTNRRI